MSELIYPLVKRMHGVLVICANENDHQKFLSCFNKMDESEGYNESIRKAMITASELNRQNKKLVDLDNV